MITRAVTQDLLGNTHIYRFPVYTYSDTVSCKCSKCGKKIKKTISFQYQEAPTEADYKWLEEQKTKRLSEEHVCTKCLKEACKSKQKLLDLTHVKDRLSAIKDKEVELENLKASIRTLLGYVREDLSGKVCLYKDKEFVINYVSYWEDFYIIQGNKIDKNKPWYTTDIHISITEDGRGCGGSKDISAKFEDVTFTTEVFAERENKIQEVEA